MGKKITWDDMKKEFPDEWLLITDFDLDKYGHIVAGIVDRHRTSPELTRLAVSFASKYELTPPA